MPRARNYMPATKCVTSKAAAAPPTLRALEGERGTKKFEKKLKTPKRRRTTVVFEAIKNEHKTGSNAITPVCCVTFPMNV